MFPPPPLYAIEKQKYGEREANTHETGDIVGQKGLRIVLACCSSPINGAVDGQCNSMPTTDGGSLFDVCATLIRSLGIRNTEYVKCCSSSIFLIVAKLFASSSVTSGRMKKLHDRYII